MKKLICLFFLIFGFSGALSAQQQDSSSVGLIGECFEDFENFMKRIEFLSPGQLQNLPIGIRTTIGNTNYDLLFTKAEFGPDYAEVTAYLRIKGPGFSTGGTTLYFGAEKIRISANGGYIGDVKLALIGNYAIGGKGGTLKIVLDGANKVGDGLPETYAILDCKGFKELQISGSLVFNNKFVKPVFEDETLDNRDLTVKFNCRVHSLEDIISEVTIPEFEVVALPEWRFKIQKAVFDFSQIRNYDPMDIYSFDVPSSSEIGAFSEIWTGVYFEDIFVRFPNCFKDKTTGKSPEFEAERMWFDERGFTGLMSVNNILSLKQGDLGGWSFSIEEFNVTIKENSLVKGEMKGEIELPISISNSFKYDLDFNTDGKWAMKVKLGEKMTFDFLKSKSVEIYSSSYVEVTKKKNEKSPHLVACLSGKMELNPFADTNSKFDLGKIEFTRMKVSNKDPYFTIDKMAFDKEIKINKFPASIDGIELRGIGKEKIILAFDTKVHFSKENKGAFAGSLGLEIKAAYKEKDSTKKWRFDGVDVSDVNIDFSNAAFAFKGAVKFYEEDKTYGNGFKGNIKFTLKPIDFSLGANMMLGSMGTYRYWYVDILADLGVVGIPVFPGFKISGMGGGAYHAMRMESDYESNTKGERLTVTGLRYLPDSTVSMGLKTYVILSTMDHNLFTADLGLSVGLNKNNGIDHVVFEGIAKFMQKTQWTGMQNFADKISKVLSNDTTQRKNERKLAAYDASITAIAYMCYDNANRSFFGSFDSYLDMGLIKGTGTDGHVGLCEMYFSKDKWFINIGKPTARLGIKLQLGPIQIKTQSYFVTGKDLPPMPPIPSKIARLLKTEELSALPNSRNITEIAGGRGFGFGADLSLNTGDMNFLLFYAKFESEIGFDILLKKYQGAFCGGTRQVPGLHGWYAAGQAYTYMFGEVGLNLKWLGAKRNFTILQGEIGALLEAQLPNPSYFGGAFALNFSILNGLLHGNCRFKFDIGEKCQLIESGFADGQEVIADVHPSTSENEIDVFAIPQVAFNMPIEQEIDAVFDGEDKLLKLNLEQYEVWNESTPISGKIRWNEENRLVEFLPNEILPSHANMQLKVKINAKEKKGASWKALQTIEGGPYEELREQKFVTGIGPDSIPWHNVRLCYPVKDQKYFYAGESKNGFVNLKQGQAGLITDENYKKRVYIISSSLDTLDVAFSYNQDEKRINWIMPVLKKGEAYRLLIVLKRISKIGERPLSAASSFSSSSNSLYKDGENEVIQETVVLKGESLQENKNKILMQYDFSTSTYSTMVEKVNDIKIVRTYRTPYMRMNTSNGIMAPSPDVHYLQAVMENSEPFDAIELKGSPYSGDHALICAKAVLEGNTYYTSDIYPLVYQYYPYDNQVVFDRNEHNKQIIPDWAVYVSSFYESANKQKQFPWIYYLPYHYKLDFDQVLCGLANASAQTIIRPFFQNWFFKSFVPIRSGLYPIRLTYVLPDGKKGSIATKTFNNIIK